MEQTVAVLALFVGGVGFQVGCDTHNVYLTVISLALCALDTVFVLIQRGVL